MDTTTSGKPFTSADFKQPYASARCLLTGCDPYSEGETHAAFLAAGGPDNDAVVFDPYSALYPPFSLVALMPFAALPWPTAHTLWEALLAASFSLAALCTAQLCLDAGSALLPVFLLAALTATSTILLMLGQISGVVIALLVLGFFCLLRERFFFLAAICFFLALLLKPHDAALPFVYLLFAGPRSRRVFFVVAGPAILFAAGSFLWFAHAPSTTHWLPELRANLHGNAAPGSVNSPAPGHAQAVNLTDLQAIFAAVRNRAAFYNGAALLVAAVLVCLLGCVLRTASQHAGQTSAGHRSRSLPHAAAHLSSAVRYAHSAAGASGAGLFAREPQSVGLAWMAFHGCGYRALYAPVS